MFKFNLEQKIKEKVTGFTGMIMGRTEYATGCIQYAIQPEKLTKDGDMKEWVWLDESRLVSLSKPKRKLKSIGGPHQTPPQW